MLRTPREDVKDRTIYKEMHRKRRELKKRVTQPLNKPFDETFLNLTRFNLNDLYEKYLYIYRLEMHKRKIIANYQEISEDHLKRMVFEPQRKWAHYISAYATCKLMQYETSDLIITDWTLWLNPELSFNQAFLAVTHYLTAYIERVNPERRFIRLQKWTVSKPLDVTYKITKEL